MKHTAGIIRTTYEIITPESAEEGDVADSGWIDEEGTEYTPEEVFSLVRSCEPSSSHYDGADRGPWYTEYGSEDSDGETENTSYHLDGFSPEDQKLIFDSVKAGHWLGEDEEETVEAAAATAGGEEPGANCPECNAEMPPGQTDACPECGWDEAGQGDPDRLHDAGARVAEAEGEEPAAPTEAEFKDALKAFMSFAQGVIDDDMKQYKNITYKRTLSADQGKRYVRIVRSDVYPDGKVGSRGVHVFVDKTNGDILKAASWKAPAKHARGNIFKPESYKGSVSPYGGTYLRGGSVSDRNRLHAARLLRLARKLLTP